MSNSNEDIQAVGSYIMLEELGSGSFATVYRCEHTLTHQQFAGKLYDLDFAISERGYRMIRKEVSILKLLRSPKTIRFEEAVYTQGGVLLVMELVDGRTLLNVMPASGGLPEAFARPVFRQIVDALFFLHCNGIVHRDLKLENVMIQNGGEVKLIDFGLADYVPEEARREGLLIRHRYGSPHYYAPEMILAINHEEFQGDKVDIWAAGVLLFSLITGFHPFFAEGDDELFDQILNLEVPYHPETSKELEDLLRRIFIKNPANRASLREIQNHPWTNDTVLAGEAGSWLEYSDTPRCSSLSRSPSVSPSVEEQSKQMKRSGDTVFSQASRDESRVPFLTRGIASSTRRTSSTEAVDGEQAAYSNSEEESPTNETVVKRPSGMVPEAAVCRTWKGLKVCLSKILGRKNDLEDAGTTYSEITTLTSYGDENQPPSRSESAASSRGMNSAFGKSEAGYERKRTSRMAPFWKITFLCWGTWPREQ